MGEGLNEDRTWARARACVAPSDESCLTLFPMPYRRTENVVRKLSARRAAILAAAEALASESGMGSVQIAPVAERAGIAAGTVYRYFPSKTALVTALVEAQSAAEIAALGRAADAAPGPLSAPCATI